MIKIFSLWHGLHCNDNGNNPNDEENKKLNGNGDIKEEPQGEDQKKVKTKIVYDKKDAEREWGLKKYFAIEYIDEDTEHGKRKRIKLTWKGFQYNYDQVFEIIKYIIDLVKKGLSDWREKEGKKYENEQRRVWLAYACGVKGELTIRVKPKLGSEIFYTKGPDG